jgi:hypothetical protein
MVIGIRCSNQDFSYAILDGTKAAPILINKSTISFPRNYSRCKELKWFYQELEGLKDSYEIKEWGIKGAEPMAQKGKFYAARIENEAMIFLLCANIGNDNVIRKVKQTIAKNLGFKGKSKYLKEVEFDNIEGYDNCNEKIKEAILVAWSCLK